MFRNVKWIGLAAASFGAGVLLSSLFAPKWVALIVALALVVSGIGVIRRCKRRCC